MGIKFGEELPGHVWPGGYPVVYYDKNGESFCAKCASKNRSFDPIVDGDAYYEGPPQFCADCGTEMESAYGDPDAEKSPVTKAWKKVVRAVTGKR
jgi:hypothetical protein